MKSLLLLDMMFSMQKNLTKIHQEIQKWYKVHGRVDLPWRTTDNTYHIYISEVMLQQTQVQTVLKRYYSPFLKKFPTLQALSKASLDEVLKMWEGLGYYNRAKNLHMTANILTDKAQAQNISPSLPSEIDELIQLPGIGKNTAHALAALAFKKPLPVMEANVKRIISRLYKLKTPTDKTLWKTAYDIVDKSNPFYYNQAMMDIGAMLCTPKNPQCEICPLNSICQGKVNPTLYPTKKKRTVAARKQNIMLYLYKDKLSLTRRTDKFLHGLWGFKEIGVPLSASKYIGEITHTYTHFKLHCKVYLYHERTAAQKHYFTTQEIEKLAISKVDEKIVKLYLDTIINI